ncbi:hypothetical protein STAS_20352 [Striga asiatica]|uniref:Uncharacterized protein n=1 Tax=Striga asiatica TaxID=4170 RepID=A0A5A7QE69_STRAF|nr:hypothetical protein STAS_20352 [Striga asiatica]
MSPSQVSINANGTTQLTKRPPDSKSPQNRSDSWWPTSSGAYRTTDAENLSLSIFSLCSILLSTTTNTPCFLHAWSNAVLNFLKISLTLAGGASAAVGSDGIESMTWPHPSRSYLSTNCFTFEPLLPEEVPQFGATRLYDDVLEVVHEKERLAFASRLHRSIRSSHAIFRPTAVSGESDSGGSTSESTPPYSARPDKPWTPPSATGGNFTGSLMTVASNSPSATQADSASRSSAASACALAAPDGLPEKTDSISGKRPEIARCMSSNRKILSGKPRGAPCLATHSGKANRICAPSRVTSAKHDSRSESSLAKTWSQSIRSPVKSVFTAVDTPASHVSTRQSSVSGSDLLTCDELNFSTPSL